MTSGVHGNGGAIYARMTRFLRALTEERRHIICEEVKDVDVCLHTTNKVVREKFEKKYNDAQWFFLRNTSYRISLAKLPWYEGCIYAIKVT